MSEGRKTTKTGYCAAGLGRSAIERRVVDAERARAGTTAHPWPEELRLAMVDACDGALSQAEIDKRIDTLRIGHETQVMAAEKALRARKRGK